MYQYFNQLSVKTIDLIYDSVTVQLTPLFLDPMSVHVFLTK